jgi:hypothetical protein
MPTSAFWARSEFFVARISWFSSMATAMACERVICLSSGAPIAGGTIVVSMITIVETIQCLTIGDLLGIRFKHVLFFAC